jgi:hypothetical protein
LQGSGPPAVSILKVFSFEGRFYIPDLGHFILLRHSPNWSKLTGKRRGRYE